MDELTWDNVINGLQANEKDNSNETEKSVVKLDKSADYKHDDNIVACESSADRNVNEKFKPDQNVNEESELKKGVNEESEPKKSKFKAPIFQPPRVAPIKSTTSSSGGTALPHPAAVYKLLQPESLTSDSLSVTNSQSTGPRISYSYPKWGGKCPEDSGYTLEVLKAGVELPAINLSGRDSLLVGRLPSCNIPMEHPSLSRHHAVFQFCPESTDEKDRGWYLFDLSSTHGSVVNKSRVPPGVFLRLHVGHVMKFGGSSRLFILQGPTEDQEKESELTYTELKEKRDEQIRSWEARREEHKLRATQVETTCSWGMAEDAKEVTDVNPFADLEPLHEERYREDPKRALRQWCDREGHPHPQFEFLDAGFGKQHCRVELPVLDEHGRPVHAEAIVSGKRREAIVACALEACSMLDRMGEFVRESSAGRRKTSRDWESEDYYDSDEDTFLDRTGELEKKRAARMRRAGAKNAPRAETFDSLCAQLGDTRSEITRVEEKLAQATADLSAAQRAASELDELEAYMRAIRAGALDRRSRLQLKTDLMRLRKEEGRLLRLVNKTRPVSMPPLRKQEEKPAENVVTSPKKEEIKEENIPLVEERVDVVDESAENQLDLEKSSPILSNIKDPVTIEIVPEDQTEPITLEKTSPAAQTSDPISPVKTSPLGPFLPPDWHAPSPPPAKVPKSDNPDTGVCENVTDKSHRRKNSRKETTSRLPKGYDHSNPDISMWLPPSNQTGDGRTSLNDKLGY